MVRGSIPSRILGSVMGCCQLVGIAGQTAGELHQEGNEEGAAG